MTASPVLIAPRRPRRWLTLVKLALLSAVLALVAWTLTKQWRAIGAAGIAVHVRPLPLLGAAAVLAVVALVQAVSYRTLLGAYATAPDWRAMPTIAWVPPMGKYVPGGAVVAAVAMLRRLHVPTAVAVAVVLVQDGLAQLAGLVFSAPLLWWPPVESRYPSAKWASLPVIAAALVALWPRVFAFGINTLLRLLNRSALPRTPRARRYALPLACAFGQWVLHGAALGLIVQGVTGEPPWRQFGLLMGFAALSQTLGYLAFFAPGGLGVREGVLLVCLTPMIGPLAAVVVPIRAIAQVVVDLTMGGIGLFVAGARSRTTLPTNVEN